MKILIGYDGSGSADAAIAATGKLLAGSDVEAIVLSVWEPVSVAADDANPEPPAGVVTSAGNGRGRPAASEPGTGA